MYVTSSERVTKEDYKAQDRSDEKSDSFFEYRFFRAVLLNEVVRGKKGGFLLCFIDDGGILLFRV